MPPTAHKAPTCQTCGNGMALQRITPCAENYDMLSYRCAKCALVFIMVEPRLEDRDAVDERRVVQRHAVTLPATIVSGSRTIACTMHDVSAAGASLHLLDRLPLPKEFTLTTAGSELPCHAIWRRGREIGIAFD
jgi:PilZ domain